jgi:hypothetical protein
MGIRQTKARLGSIILMLAISIPGGGSEAERPTPMSELVPLEIHGWKAKGKDAIYNRQTIFDYMNGAGEIYRLYGFRELFVRRFVKAGHPDIILEMFDMGSSEDAFGVLSHGREGQGEDVAIGGDSEYDRGLLFFWQGRFYISIYAVRETPSAKRAVLDVGRTISRTIGVQGERPKLIDYLPRRGLIEKSIRYFHNHFSLNLHYFVADENILHLDDRTKAVLARYQHNGAKTYLLWVQYQTPKKAKVAFESFMGAYMPEAKRTGIAQLENGRWAAASVEHVFIIAVFDAPTMAHAETLLKAAMEKLEAKRP